VHKIVNCVGRYLIEINDKAVSIIEKLSAIIYNRKAEKIIIKQEEEPWSM